MRTPADTWQEARRRSHLTVRDLIGLLEQLPSDAVMKVEGDDIVPPRLSALLDGDPKRDVCLMDPAHGMVDHVDGRILR